MKRIPKGKYKKESREEAAKLVIEGGLSLPEAGRRLSLPPSTIGNWVRAYKAGGLGEIGKRLPCMDRQAAGSIGRHTAAAERERYCCMFLM